MNLDDTDMTHQSAHVTPPRTAAARQLRKSRQHLGLQRHDLLVAMRVINIIEREMVQAEWESWLLEENTKCKHLGGLILQNDAELIAGQSGREQLALGADLNRLEKVRIWEKEYCGSCKKELERIGI